MPFVMVMIEALACGTPVIAFPEGAARELVVDQKTGFLVEDEAATSAQSVGCRAARRATVAPGSPNTATSTQSPRPTRPIYRSATIARRLWPGVYEHRLNVFAPGRVAIGRSARRHRSPASKLAPVLPKALAGRAAVERLTRCLVDRIGRAPAGTGRLDPLDPGGHDVLIEAIRALESPWMVRGADVL